MKVSTALATLSLLIMMSVPALGDTFTWIQLGENNKVSAWAIVEHGVCPTLMTKRGPLVMQPRAGDFLDENGRALAQCALISRHLSCKGTK